MIPYHSTDSALTGALAPSPGPQCPVSKPAPRAGLEAVAEVSRYQETHDSMTWSNVHASNTVQLAQKQLEIRGALPNMTLCHTNRQHVVMLSVVVVFPILPGHSNSLFHNALCPSSALAQQLEHSLVRHETCAAGRWGIPQGERTPRWPHSVF